MDILISFLERLNLWAWWAIAGLLLIGEVLTGTTYFLWIAAAAFMTGFAALEVLGVSWQLQLALFTLMSMLSLWAGDRWVRPKLSQGVDSGLNARGDRMIGQTVITTSDFVAGRGRVSFGDTEWAAETQDGQDPKVGSRMSVVEVKGVMLLVATMS